jgi:hypothetical protein
MPVDPVSRAFGAVGFAEPRLVLEVRRDLFALDPAVAPLVLLEDVGCQRVAASVPDAQSGVDPDLHRAFAALAFVSQTSGRYCTSRMPGV